MALNIGLKIQHINIHSVRPKLTELIEVIKIENPDVISLNETFLKPQMKDPAVPGYDWIRADRKTEKGGGVAFLIKRTIPHLRLDDVNIRTGTPHEHISIELLSSDRKPFYITTIYCPHGHPSPTFFHRLCHDKHQHIICGDFNSKHTSLGNRHNTPSGQALLTIITDNNLLITNDETPTYYCKGTQTESILDHILISKSLSSSFNDILIHDEDIGSDHNLMTAWFGLKTLTNDDNQTRTIRLYHKLDWTETNNNLLHDYNSSNTSRVTKPHLFIDAKTDTLTNLIQSIQNKIPTQNIKPKNIGLPTEVRELIKDKRKTRNKWKKTKDPQLKTKYNFLKQKLTKLIQREKENKWESFCDDMELDGQNSAWAKIKSVVNKKKGKFNYPTLKSMQADGKIKKSITTEEKIEAFYSSLKPTFEDNIDPLNFDDTFKQNIDEIVENKNLHFKRSDGPCTDAPTIKPEEINKLINGLNPKKASGPDKINNKIIKHLKPSLSVILAEIFTLSLKHGHIPKSWKEAAVLVIKKPDKLATDPSSYRPISLLNCLGKMLETVVTSKLYSWAETNNKINAQQSGFRKQRSTQDQLFKLTQQIARSV